MKIIFSFTGGCMNDVILLDGDDRRESERKAVETYYSESDGGTVGRLFRVPREDTFDEYVVVRRLQLSDRVLIRAAHLVRKSEAELAREEMFRH